MNQNVVIMILLGCLMLQSLTYACLQVQVFRASDRLSGWAADNNKVVHQEFLYMDTVGCDSWFEKYWGGSDAVGYLWTKHNCKDLGENEWRFERPGFKSGWMRFNQGCPITVTTALTSSSCKSFNYNCGSLGDMVANDQPEVVQ
ncbi:hypothetical protein SAMD00019534_079710, partial [Acytostelium subglobosum LB1]|uniref:hypothetical protein n=1 Tax=Acytostelium subglobosum LB1 TaxID=1410327 RepID=UPI0006450665